MNHDPVYAFCYSGFLTVGAAMRRKWRWFLLALLLLALLVVVHVRTHPLVFMEAHVHCIKFAALEFQRYADENNGRFPFHPRGYGNALLMLDEEAFYALTGPGYDAGPLHEAKQAGRDLPDGACGRVYVQGLTRKSNGDIALLFDKLPTPGGDHGHLPYRLWAPLGREVLFVNDGFTFIPETEWPEFAQKQVELLVREGFPREEAERLFAQK